MCGWQGMPICFKTFPCGAVIEAYAVQVGRVEDKDNNGTDHIHVHDSIAPLLFARLNTKIFARRLNCAA